jgi:hypothetical protein
LAVAFLSHDFRIVGFNAHGLNGVRPFKLLHRCLLLKVANASVNIAAKNVPSSQVTNLNL